MSSNFGRAATAAVAALSMAGAAAPARAQARLMSDCYMTVVGGHPIAVLNAHGPGECTFAKVRVCAGDRIIATLKSTPKPVEITDKNAAKVETCTLPKGPGH